MHGCEPVLCCAVQCIGVVLVFVRAFDDALMHFYFDVSCILHTRIHGFQTKNHFLLCDEYQVKKKAQQQRSYVSGDVFRFFFLLSSLLRQNRLCVLK